MGEDNVYLPPTAELEAPITDQLAGRWLRLGGSLIDGLISLIVMLPIMIYTDYWDKAVAGEVSGYDIAIYAVIGLMVFVCLNAYLLVNYGQSIGKRVVGTRIVSTTTNDILPFSRFFFLRYLPMMVLFNIPGIGQFFALFDCLLIFRSDKRCAHDLIAGSKVVIAE